MKNNNFFSDRRYLGSKWALTLRPFMLPAIGIFDIEKIYHLNNLVGACAPFCKLSLLKSHTAVSKSLTAYIG